MNNKYSNYKIVWFPDKLESLLQNTITAPIYIRIKPTNKCCHDCYFCVYNYSFSHMHDNMDRIDEIPGNKMIRILEDLKTIGIKAITYSGGGEPLVYSNIIETLLKTLDLKIDLSMLTNGQKLCGNIAEIMSEAKWIRVSMDYWNKDMFKKTRRVSSNRFNHIIDNLKNFAKIKKKCDLGVNYIITQENHETLIEAFKVIADTGIDNIRFSPLWIPDFYLYHSGIIEEVRRQLDYIYTYNTYNTLIFDSYNIYPEINTRNYQKCFSCQVVPVIGADQNIYTCHNKAYSPDGIIGSIKEKDFSEIWFSDKTHRFFNNFRPDLLCHHQCANDKKNQIIHEIIDCYGDNYV